MTKYFKEYAGRMPTAKEIRHMRNHKEARVLSKPTIQAENGKINKRTMKKVFSP